MVSSLNFDVDVYISNCVLSLDSGLIVCKLSFSGIKCPVCSKFIPPDDIECHLVMCLTKPRISYNGKLEMLFILPKFPLI